jgi:uncharacterized protein YdcH (DUF465 family)
MEQKELELIDRFSENDAELKSLWEEHQLYEKQLEKLENKPYLTPSEVRVVKEIKKKKLAGKTRLQSILDRYRTTEA